MGTSIFIHGLESSNQGTKAVFFREAFPRMIIPTFTGGLFARMEALEGVLEGRSDLRLVGSSFGGLMATLFAMNRQDRVTRMVLLAPALTALALTPYEPRKISVPVEIYHGGDDRVIPVEEVERISSELFLDCSFHRVDDDHYLHDTFPRIDWERLLA